VHFGAELFGVSLLIKAEEGNAKSTGHKDSGLEFVINTIESYILPTCLQMGEISKDGED
jgi:hypothetical protein